MAISNYAILPKWYGGSPTIQDIKDNGLQFAQYGWIMGIGEISTMIKMAAYRESDDSSRYVVATESLESGAGVYLVYGDPDHEELKNKNFISSGDLYITYLEYAGQYNTYVTSPIYSNDTQAIQAMDDEIWTQTNISGATISDISDYEYTGEAIEPPVTVRYNGNLLTEDTDYVVSYANNINVGTASVIITGINMYTGTKTTTFEITPQPVDIDEATVQAIPDQTYTGSYIVPEVVVTYDGNTLTEDTDYIAEYSDNLYVGTATVTLTGIGDYTGQRTVTFAIVPANISEATIADIPDQTYTGEAITPTVVVTYNERELIVNIEYTRAYSDNIEVGTATVTVTGIGDYIGTKTATFEIVAPTPTPTKKERRVAPMNGGYVMVDAEGLELTAQETQTVEGLYEALKTAKGTDKPVYIYTCVYDEMPVTPIHVFLTELDNGNIVGTASVLQVFVAPDDTVTINSMIAG